MNETKNTGSHGHEALLIILVISPAYGILFLQMLTAQQKKAVFSKQTGKPLISCFLFDLRLQPGHMGSFVDADEEIQLK